jgi:hypothetical protein
MQCSTAGPGVLLRRRSPTTAHLCWQRQRQQQQQQLSTAHITFTVARRPASSYRGRGGRRSSTVPLVVPFVNRDATAALAHFQSWVEKNSRWSFDSSAIKLAKPQPVYLPFFAFEAAIDVKFSGSLGYTTSHTYYDKDGRSRTRRETSWYSKSGIRVPRQHLSPESARNAYMLQYAGFEYRRTYIDESTSNMLRDYRNVLGAATPMRAAMLPDQCAVHAFEMKPSFAYGEAACRCMLLHVTLAPIDPWQ